MRSHLLFFACSFALAVACGGRTDDVLLGGGGGSSGGGSSGASSGGSGSSGAGSGSSGASSGSSSGAGGCTPLPGCHSADQCPDPNGCGTCVCEAGQWACSETGPCADGGPFTDGGPGMCPPEPPPEGSPCFDEGTGCGWATSGGCGESCYCKGGAWQCEVPPCPPPPPTCPQNPPQDQTPCSDIGAFCDYSLSGVCGDYQCQCYPSGIWGCVESSCVDAGPPPVDAGPPDAGFPECPPAEPKDGTACKFDGTICSYGFCPTNCLCANGAWVCAAQAPCVDGG